MVQRYLRRDLSKRLQRRLRHLERLQLSRGHHLGGWSQVRRQMRGHWLDSAHGLRGQDLWQGRWLGHWKRLEEEKGALLLRHKRNLVTLKHACTRSPTYTLPHIHSDSQPHHICTHSCTSSGQHVLTNGTDMHTANHIDNIGPHSTHTSTHPNSC